MSSEQDEPRAAAAMGDLVGELQACRRQLGGLYESAAGFRLLLDHSFEACAVYEVRGAGDPGRLYLCNDRYAALTGHSREELLDPNSGLAPGLWWHTERAHRELHQAWLDGGQPVTGQAQATNGLGRTAELEYRLVPYHVAGTSFVMAVLRDVTSLRRAEQQLTANATQMLELQADMENSMLQYQQAIEYANQMALAAEIGNTAKSEFLANMSHEIRTPMNGIIGMTDLALETELSGEQREYLSLVRSSADALLTLINDILDFSKIEAGKMVLDPVEFELRQLLSDTVGTVGIRAYEKGLELILDVADEVPDQIVADNVRLRQVILNLAGNALKFTTQGEVVVAAAVEDEDEEGLLLHFSVRDTGIGIPADKLALVFEAFSQADGSTTRKYGGTGLGLAISTQLTELMGGRIWVESEEGVGSVFHFTMRCHRGTARAARQALALVGLPVLVVEDNDSHRAVIERMLRGWQALPMAVPSAREALLAMERARREQAPFALALVDSQLEDMDGFVVIEDAREHPGAVQQCVMLLAPAGPRGDAARCRELGVATYTTKPITASELLAAIEMALEPGGSTARRRHRESAAAEQAVAYRVLLAEDNHVNQKLAVRLLSKAGHTVQIAHNGREAVALFDDLADEFDLILMDIQMPELNGYEATAAIRQMEVSRGGHKPIIAMTAHAMKGDRERCLEAGMDGYVSKPIQAKDLLRVIAELGPARPTAAVNGAEPAAPAASSAEPDLQPAEPGVEPPGLSEPPVPAAAADDLPVLAINEAMDRFAGDCELARELLELFLDDLPRLHREVSAAAQAGDAVVLERAAHTLKGAVGNFGAKPAFAAAQRLEQLGRSGELREVDAALAALDVELERLRPALVAFHAEVTVAV
ncbi:MAG: response regulator [Fimbriimonadaceae bacterium]|nr:response regulator [Fimbriimonadaceae bacterium]